MQNRTHTRLVRLVCFAVLIAMQIVLSRFCSINAWNLKIGFGFLPVAVAGAMFGPAGGAIVGALSDFLGAVLFPIGPYFPGFTLCLALTGAAFGLALYKKPAIPRMAAAVVFDQLVLSLLVNSYWISVLYGSPYLPLLATRIFQCLIMLPVELILTSLVLRTLRAAGKPVRA